MCKCVEIDVKGFSLVHQTLLQLKLKNMFKGTNDKVQHVSDPLVQKRHECLSQKRIKSALVSYPTINSVINPQDPNLFVKQQHFHQAVSSRTPLRVLNTNNIEEGSNSELIDNSITEGVPTLEETASKRKYICKVCGELGHNARNKAKCSKQCW